MLLWVRIRNNTYQLDLLLHGAESLQLIHLRPLRRLPVRGPERSPISEGVKALRDAGMGKGKGEGKSIFSPHISLRT